MIAMIVYIQFDLWKLLINLFYVFEDINCIYFSFVNIIDQFWKLVQLALVYL